MIGIFLYKMRFNARSIYAGSLTISALGVYIPYAPSITANRDQESFKFSLPFPTAVIRLLAVGAMAGERTHQPTEGCHNGHS